MAQKYTPIWDDWLTVTRELNAQEKGRLIDAIVTYDNGGDWQELIKGNERYVFPGYQVRLDLWQSLSETRSKSAKGSKVEQTQANDSKSEQTQANDSKIHKVKVKVKDINNTTTARAREDSIVGSVDLDPLILKVQQELNGLTDTHYQALNDYRESLGDELVSYAVDQAVGNGVRNWNYVEAILRGWVAQHITTIGEAKAENQKHKQQPARTGGKVVSAQLYHQREYNEEENERVLGVRDLFEMPEAEFQAKYGRAKT